MGSIEGSGRLVRLVSPPSALFPAVLSYLYLFFLNEYVGRVSLPAPCLLGLQEAVCSQAEPGWHGVQLYPA